MLIEVLANNFAIGKGKILAFFLSKGIKPDRLQTLDRDMVKMTRKKEFLDEENLDNLQESPPVLTIIGHADHRKLQKLRANPDTKAKTTVMKARLHKSKRLVATFLVQNGTLKRRDVVVCRKAFRKVGENSTHQMLISQLVPSFFPDNYQPRALFDDGGKQIAEAGPSIPVHVHS